MSNPFRPVIAVLVTASALGASLAGSGPTPLTALSELPIAGGLEGARTVVADRASADRALFLPELIVRFFNTPVGTRAADILELQALIARLDQCGTPSPGTTCGPADALPLPLTADWWIASVFHGRSSPDTLVRDIVRSHDAALFYWSLLTLDDATRSWFARKPGLVAAASGDRASVLALLAPGLRVVDGRIVVPGGEPARAAWESLAGVETSDPAGFVQRLLDADDGWMAFYVASLAHLTQAQLQVVLHLDDSDRDRPRSDLHRLYHVFVSAGRGWKLASRPFSRPPMDPLLLLGDLQVDPATGRALLPGGQVFWNAVFEMDDSNELKPSLSLDAAADGPVDVPWLLARVFEGDLTLSKRRADQVSFAQRAFAGATPQGMTDMAVAVAALDRHPALIRALERLDIHDPRVYRQTIARAMSLDAIRDTGDRTRALAQFQGALTLLIRAIAAGSLSSREAPALVTSLAAVPTSDAGRYGGKLTEWIDTHLARATPGGDVEAALLGILAGPVGPLTEVDWEGTRYRIDVSGAESRRMAQTRGEAPPSFLASASAIQSAIQAITHAGSGGSGNALQRANDALTRIATDCGWDGDPRDRPSPYRDALAAVRSASRHATPPSIAAAAEALAVLSDELTARGVTELAYAAALRTPEGSAVTSALLAERHDFGVNRADSARAPVAWRSAAQSNGLSGNWNLEGSLLDLDLALAQRSLERVSWKPLAQPPSITAADRQALSEVPVLMVAAALTDQSRDLIASALGDGRALLARSIDETVAGRVAATVPLDGIRRALLPWVATHDRSRLAFMLTSSELFRLGLTAAPVTTFDPWGASARARGGCLCLRMPSAQPQYLWRGHPSAGILVSAVADLNLRVTEYLSELHMPAVLLPHVLRAATSDLADRAAVRYPDDLRGISDYVHRLSADDVEQYLDLLTADGPLVPVRASASLP